MDRHDIIGRKLIRAGMALQVNGTPVIAAAHPENTIDNNRFVVYYFGEDSRILSLVADASVIKLIEEDTPKLRSMRTNLLPVLARNNSTMNGSDPEIFVADAEGGIIPAWKFLPTEAKAKEDDKPIPGTAGRRQDGAVSEGIYAFWDGFQAETSMLNPYHCHERLTGSVHQGLNKIYIAATQLDPAAQLVAADVVKVSRKDLLDAEDAHVAFGCAPSENAYGIEPIEIGDPREMPLRFSGTHYHFSTTMAPLPKWWPNGTVKMIDRFGGIILTALGRGMDNPKRREFYGRPGEFRCKPTIAGHMEYRTTGSFVMNHPALFIFGADVCRMGYKLGLVADADDCELADAKDIIMNCDADAAQKVIAKHEAFFRKAFTHMYAPPVIERTMDLLLGKYGVKPLLSERSVAENWNLTRKDQRTGLVHSTSGTLPGNYRWADWLPHATK